MSLVSKKPTEAVTTEIHNKNSITPAHVPIADNCSLWVHVPMFL
jgi:hypothetical protein